MLTLKLSSSLLRLALLGDALLILLNLFPAGTGLIDQSLDLDREANIATWFSSAKLFTLFLLTWLLADQTAPMKRLLRLTSICFLAASISETAMLQDLAFGAAYTILHGEVLTVGMPGAWMVYFAPIVLAVLVVVVWFVLRLGRAYPEASLYLWVGLCFWSVALSAELLPRLLGWDSAATPRTLHIVEEAAELLGATAFLGGLIRAANRIHATNTTS
ncbi:MAG: hypothetical protein IPG71_06490 [bacterium]|nr:hypothetical protein [bacterium]